MLLSNVRRLSLDRGYTLAEILVVLVIIGISAALAAPNLISWSHRQKMRSAVKIVQGAMEDAQRQAIRLGKKCTLQLDGARNDGMTTYNRLTAETTDRGQCLVATASARPSGLDENDKDRVILELPNEIRMVTNIASYNNYPKIVFSFLGNVSHPNQALDLFPSDSSNPAENFKKYPMIVLYSTLENPSSASTSQQRRCVVIVSMLGALRTGIYKGALTDLDANQCKIQVDGGASN
ncbi:prepilin-type N-terminal cleavage/methylation domain-containing protein [Pannus brasiliensis CCIBt3594]|uniref:Prepilin-type N-terminal cleavage/methylation domain-containing protein n=1 Tax=Pannus brasiliensis CCIBt3594 TaxID=1427578 RepID=A0AAW9QRZ7_9CHRO